MSICRGRTLGRSKNWFRDVRRRIAQERVPTGYRPSLSELSSWKTTLHRLLARDVGVFPNCLWCDCGTLNRKVSIRRSNNCKRVAGTQDDVGLTATGSGKLRIWERVKLTCPFLVSAQ